MESHSLKFARSSAVTSTFIAEKLADFLAEVFLCCDLSKTRESWKFQRKEGNWKSFSLPQLPSSPCLSLIPAGSWTKRPLLGSAEQAPWAALELLFCCAVLPSNLQHWRQWGQEPSGLQRKNIGQRVCKGENIPFKQTEVTLSAREFFAECGVLSIFTFFLLFSFLSWSPQSCLVSVFLTFPVRSNGHSSHSVAIPHGGLSFHSLAAVSASCSSKPRAFPPGDKHSSTCSSVSHVQYFTVPYFDLLFCMNFHFSRLFQWSMFRCLAPAHFLYRAAGLVVLGGCRQQSPVISCRESGVLWGGWSCRSRSTNA